MLSLNYPLTAFSSKFRFFMLLIALFIYGTLRSQTTYFTVADGTFKNKNIWNGGVYPGGTVNVGDTMKILHHVYLNNDINVEGVLIVSADATIDGEKKIMIEETGIFYNDGNVNIGSQEFHIDGFFYNTGYLYADKMHSDGYICNSGVMEMDPGEKFNHHGGTIECWGSIICCEMEMHENSGHLGDPELREQNVCCTDNTATYIDLKDGTIDSSTTFFCDFLLPIELASFTAELQGNDVILNWSTTKETDNEYFYVERSGDGQQWETVHRVDGAGTTNLTTAYTAWDYAPVNGINYYRLKQVDINGDYAYSTVVSVQLISQSLNAGQLQVRAEGQLLQVQLKENSPFQFGEIVVSNAVGKIIYRQVINEDTYEIAIPVREAAGIVVVSVYLDQQRLTSKVFVE